MKNGKHVAQQQPWKAPLGRGNHQGWTFCADRLLNDEAVDGGLGPRHHQASASDVFALPQPLGNTWQVTQGTSRRQENGSPTWDPDVSHTTFLGSTKNDGSKSKSYPDSIQPLK